MKSSKKVIFILIFMQGGYRAGMIMMYGMATILIQKVDGEHGQERFSPFISHNKVYAK